MQHCKVISGKAEKGSEEAKKRQQAIKKVAGNICNICIPFFWNIWNIWNEAGKLNSNHLKYSLFEISLLKVASSHADFFVFESFRRNCSALVVKSAILKLKNKNQWLFLNWRTKKLTGQMCFFSIAKCF